MNSKQIKILSVILFLLTLTIWVIMRDECLTYAIFWLVSCLAIAFLFCPFLPIRVLLFPDGGFVVSMLFGTVLSFLLSWLLSAAGFLAFDTKTAFLSLFLLPATAVLYRRFGSKRIVLKQIPAKQVLSMDQIDLPRFFFGFTLFAFLFTLAIYFRGFRPEISHITEQYMDYGFLRTILRQKTAFPEDFWFSGQPLNYYYLGQALCVWLLRISNVPVEYGYHFCLATVFAGVGLLSYSFVSAFISAAFVNSGCPSGGAGSPSSAAPAVGSAVSFLLTVCGGNGHFVLYGLFVPVVTKLFGYVPKYSSEHYWFATSTEYIGHFPETSDVGKHEFPAYTFVLGDLHAHALNLLFVLLLLTILSDLALSNASISENTEAGEKKTDFRYFAAKLFEPRILFIGVLLGYFQGSNYWDFAIYFVVAGAVILFTDLTKDGFSLNTVGWVLGKGAVIFGLSKLILLPFLLRFQKMTSGIAVALTHSPPNKWLILWGVPVLLGTLFLLRLFLAKRKSGDKYGSGEAVLFALFPCAIGLLLLPELIYVRDIYENGYSRFNTMFKLTYQAFLLFAIGLGIAAGVGWIRKYKIITVVIIVWALLCSVYIFVAMTQFFGKITDPGERRDCVATDFLLTDAALLPEAEVIYLLNQDPRERLHVLEGAGESYAPDCKISVFTGSCTVVGWKVHEWMWHNAWESVGERCDEVRDFYTLGDPAYCIDFIGRYEIDYVFVGERELEHYAVDPAGFAALGEEVYSSVDGRTKLYRVNRDNLYKFN